MNKIDKLIDELCPEGIKQSRIGDFARCVAGATPSTGDEKYWEDGTIPWMSSGEVNKGTVTETDNFITKAGFDSCSTKMLPAGTVVIALAGQGKTRGMVARTRIQVCTNQSLCGIIPDDSIDSDFLYHFLKSRYRQLRDMSSGDGGRGGLNLEIVRSVIMPVPPLQVQQEIVTILDKFTELEAELEAELSNRSKQFKYFCDYYFSGNFANQNSIEFQPLGSQGSFQKGSGLQKSDFVETGVPCIHYGQIHTRFGSQTYEAISSIKHELASGLRKAQPGDIVIADTAEDYAGVAKATAWLGTDPIAVGGHTLIYSHQFDPIYLSYFLRSDAFQYQKNRLAKGVKVKDISSSAIAKIVAPVPPVGMQEEIGRNLMALDTLIIDSPGSIKAEITARRQQYEHYRNKLLTFKELKAS